MPSRVVHPTQVRQQDLRQLLTLIAIDTSLVSQNALLVKDEWPQEIRGQPEVVLWEIRGDGTDDDPLTGRLPGVHRDARS
jgi:hypothetical protein